MLRLAVSLLGLPATAASSSIAATLRPCSRRFSSTCFNARRPAHARGLTLPSSGLAPAGRATLSLHFTFRAACRCEPLMSNVRHRKAPVRQDRALKAKSSMPFKRSLTISRQLNGCELVVEAKHWQNIERAQCKVATSCNVHAPGGGATEVAPRSRRPPVPQAGGRLTHLAARKGRPIQVARSVTRQAHYSPT